MYRCIVNFLVFVFRPQILAVFFYVFSSSNISAAETDIIARISQSKQWRSLLGYKNGTSVFKEDPTGKNYFLNPMGSENPHLELITTMEQINADFVEDQTNDHAICKFPARFKFLKKQVKLNKDLKDLKKCEDYQKWIAGGKIQSVSLYFASGYFGNPASYFGHPLLKFNIKDENPDLLQNTLNFGALTPDQENPILYVLYGLFGGYSATFSSQAFYYHDHNYGNNEMRDLWEYELNLSQNELEHLVDRSWELLGVKQSYLFLSKNCASQMAQLIEEATQQKLYFRNSLYVIPIDIFDNLKKAKRKSGKSYVKNIRLRPSKQTELENYYANLNPKEKEVLRKLIESPNRLQELTNKLDTISKIKIIDTAISYYSHRLLIDPTNGKLKKMRAAILLARLDIKQKSDSDFNKLATRQAPHLMNNSFRISLGPSYIQSSQTSFDFHIRPALYDELSLVPQQQKHSSLVVFDTKLKANTKGVHLSQLDIFRISSFPTNRLDLPGTREASWKANLSIVSSRSLCDSCRIPELSYSYGISEGNYKTKAYALIGIGLSENVFDSGSIFALPEVGFFWELANYWKIHLNFLKKYFLNGLKKQKDKLVLSQRFGSNKSWDIDIDLTHQKYSEVSLRLNLYF